MIILDTNVISEVMRGPRVDQRVLEWVVSQAEPMVTTVVNRAEILAGIAVLPDGRRKSLLWSASEAAFGRLGACLPLMPECAAAYAEIVAARRLAGRPIGGMDALIASIASVSAAKLATRDTTDFDELGLELVNPWQNP